MSDKTIKCAARPGGLLGCGGIKMAGTDDEGGGSLPLVPYSAAQQQQAVGQG